MGTRNRDNKVWKFCCGVFKMNSNILKKLILQIIKEEKEKEENLLGEPDLSKEDDREDDDKEGHHDEQNVAANVAGYTLPLGASNHPSNLKKRGEIAGSAFGGAKPAKKKKGEPDKDWYK